MLSHGAASFEAYPAQSQPALIAIASSPFETYESVNETSWIESGSKPSVFGAMFGARMWRRRAVNRRPSTGWIVQKA